jgi:hypothetical protein
VNVWMVAKSMKHGLMTARPSSPPSGTRSPISHQHAEVLS